MKHLWYPTLNFSNHNVIQILVAYVTYICLTVIGWNSKTDRQLLIYDAHSLLIIIFKRRSLSTLFLIATIYSIVYITQSILSSIDDYIIVYRKIVIS